MYEAKIYSLDLIGYIGIATLDQLFIRHGTSDISTRKRSDNIYQN